MGLRGRSWRALLAAFAMGCVLAPVAQAHHATGHAPSPYDVEFEGESMTGQPASASGNSGDSAAWLGMGKHLFANGSVVKTVTASRPSVHLLVRIKPVHCLGEPQVNIKAGGKTWWSGALSGDGYRWINQRISLPAGSHTVEVEFTNNLDQWAGPLKVCDRGVVVDHVALVASPFAANGWRNAPLASNAPIWTEKETLFRDEIIDQIADDIASDRPFKSGVWVSTDSWSTPIYTVPFDQPKVRVDAGGNAALQAQWEEVPLPPNARTANPQYPTGDAVLLVWQPSTNTLWEFIGLRNEGTEVAPNWKGYYGGRLTNVSSHEGHFPGPEGRSGGYGASASAISLLAGQPRLEEIRRALAEPGVGSLDHAVDFGVMTPRGRAGWCWPAQRTDGKAETLAPEAIPAGTRFRLPASLDIDAYAAQHNLNPYVEMMAKTIQKHGMIARDRGAVFGWWGEDPTPTGTFPYAAWWNNKPPSAMEPDGLFRDFPFEYLQPLAPTGEGCMDDPTPGVPD